MIRKLISRIFDLPASLAGNKSKPRVLALAQHGVRRDALSHAALRVVSRLQDAGFAAYVVGGAVRDLLLGVTPKDFDVATSATPEQVHHLFRRSRIIGRRFRIVHVMMGPETIEVTTFRGGEVANKNETGRVMADNTYGNQVEDALRRDFTVNALFYNPTDETIIDYHHGVKDLRARKLVMIGQPAEEILKGAKAMLDDGLLTHAYVAARIEEAPGVALFELAVDAAGLSRTPLEVWDLTRPQALWRFDEVRLTADARVDDPARVLAGLARTRAELGLGLAQQDHAMAQLAQADHLLEGAVFLPAPAQRRFGMHDGQHRLSHGRAP